MRGTEAGDTSGPSWSGMVAAGPLTDFPAMIGVIGMAFAVELRRVSRIPGTARIGAMLMKGVLGQIKMAPASRRASKTPGAAWDLSAPLYVKPATRGSHFLRTKYSWNGRIPSSVLILVGTGLIVIVTW